MPKIRETSAMNVPFGSMGSSIDLPLAGSARSRLRTVKLGLPQ